MENIEVSLVPREAIPEIWDRVSHLLKRATDLSFGRYRLRDLKEKLISGEFNLWIVFEKDTGNILSAITSTFTQYPQMKSLHGQFLGGDRLVEWRDRFCEIFDRWGRDNDCQIIEFSGRKGWGRVLEGNGYKEVYRIYERTLL